MKKLKITVIIPIFNGARFLGEAIESVLAQKYQPLEIILIDDGSTDGSAAVARLYSEKVRYIFQKNAGTAAARNSGVRAAQGSFFAFLDQDDLWVPDKLEIQMDAFAADSSLDMVFGRIKQFYSQEVDETFRETVACSSHLMPGCLPSAALVRRSSFFKVGLFEGKWQIGEWSDWYVRAAELGLQSKMLPDVVALRRLHSDNKGIRQRDRLSEYARILKCSLDRRRSRNQ